MKRIAAVAAILLLAVATQAQPLCTVRGQFFDQAGRPVSKPQVTVSNTQLVSGTYIVSRNSITHTGDTNGRIEFNVFRNAVVFLKSNTIDSLYYGQLVYIPDVDSVQLSSLPIGSTTVPPRYVVSIASTAGIQVERDGTLIADTVRIVNFTGDVTVTETPTGTVNVEYGGAGVLDSLHRLDSLAQLALANAAIAIARADSARSAVIANIESDIAELNGRLDTAGTYDRVYLYGQIGRLYDSLAVLHTGIIAQISDSISLSITDGTRSFGTMGRYWQRVDTLSFVGEAGDIIDCALGNNFFGTITANDTLSFTNVPPAGYCQIIQVRIINSGTYTLAWSGVRWQGGIAPTLTAVANKRTIYSFLLENGVVQGIGATNF